MNKFSFVLIFSSIFMGCIFKRFRLKAQNLSTPGTVSFVKIKKTVRFLCVEVEFLSGIPWLALRKHFAFYFICIFFNVQVSYTKAWDRGSFVCTAGILGCPMTTKCSKRTNKNVTQNKKWPSHSNQEGNCQ